MEGRKGEDERCQARQIRQSPKAQAEKPASAAVGNGKHFGNSGDVYKGCFSVHSVQAKNREEFTLRCSEG